MDLQMPAGQRRVAVYVDGFNLYYGALRGSPYKWLDLKRLAARVIPGKPQISLIRYFTARVKSPPWDLAKATRQDVYLRALWTIPEVRIHFGKFVEREVRRPLSRSLQFKCSACQALNSVAANTQVHVVNSEEKGSDVNLAAYLLLDAFKDLYDEAWIISNDSDLAEPVRMVREELGKSVGVIVYDKRLPAQQKQKQNVSRHLVRASGREPLFVRKRHLKAAQLPDPVLDASGQPIRKPTDW